MALAPDRFDFVPWNNRPIIKWPSGARVAFWVAPNIEHYEFLPPPNDFRNPWPRTPHPDVMNYAYRDYGNRVGFWRMLEVIDKHNVRCTASLNEAVLEHFPEIRDAMVERNWDYMTHGIYNTIFLTKFTEEEEREFYRDCIETLKKHTGKDLKGMLGPALSSTPRTPDLMAKAGLTYHADWFHDDQPFPLRVPSGRFISMPYSIELNDAPYFGGKSSWEGDDFANMCKRQFDRLYIEGAVNGQVMCIALHPFQIGQPHRIKYLDEIFRYILSHDGVWMTTADEIAQYYIDHYYDAAMVHAQRLTTEAV